MKIKKFILGLVLIAGASSNLVFAGGGPLGIDSKLAYNNEGIWKRSNQKALMSVLIGGEILGALWEGSDTPLGKTLYQAVDASIIGGVSSAVLKQTFRRSRPSETDNPNDFFKRGGQSFPSGEVTLAAAVVTPFILQYGHDQPAVYALELIPLYDAVARMKVNGHWQTDVLAGWLLGTAAGYYAHSRNESYTVSILPRGITVGWKSKF